MSAKTRRTLNDNPAAFKDSFLTVGQVAEILQVSPRKVGNACRNGTLAAYKLGDWRIRVSDLETYLETRRFRKPPVESTDDLRTLDSDLPADN